MFQNTLSSIICEFFLIPAFSGLALSRIRLQFVCHICLKKFRKETWPIHRHLLTHRLCPLCPGSGFDTHLEAKVHFETRHDVCTIKGHSIFKSKCYRDLPHQYCVGCHNTLSTNIYKAHKCTLKRKAISLLQNKAKRMKFQ